MCVNVRKQLHRKVIGKSACEWVSNWIAQSKKGLLEAHLVHLL